MAHALLIKSTNSDYNKEYLPINFEPLGLMYLSSFIKKYSQHTVAIVDAQAQSPEIYPVEGGAKFRQGMKADEIIELVRKHNPAVVGLSCLFERLEHDVIDIAKAVKSYSPEIIVVLGGMDASIRYEPYLRCGAVDLVVEGIGEETFLEIVNAVEKGAALTGMNGTIELLADGTMRKNPDRTPTVNFDDYPFPDRNAVPRKYYDNRTNQNVSYPFAREFPAVLIQSSRGCGLRCAFCQIISVYDKWYSHSNEYVVAEMKECIENFGTKEFIFLDDNFMWKPRRVAEICQLIIDTKLNVSIDIMTGISVWTLSETIIDTMVKAGLYRVCLPIESGNPDTLKFIKKPVDLEKTKTMIEYCNKKGLLTFANLIIGFPYETQKDIDITIDWGKTSGLDAINYFVAQPMPGARMYAIYEEKGWLYHQQQTQIGDSSWRGAGVWRTEHFTSDKLNDMAATAASKYMASRILFFLQPRNAIRYLWPKISSWRKLKYITKVGFYVLFSGNRISSKQRVLDVVKLFRRKRVTVPSSTG